MIVLKQYRIPNNINNGWVYSKENIITYICYTLSDLHEFRYIICSLSAGEEYINITHTR